MAVNLNVIKAYDVRGVYPKEINEEVAALVAKAFAYFLETERVVIGTDARASSPSLKKAVVDALIQMGVDVFDIGLCTTPLLNYTVAKKNFPGGIMITASHNPAEYNALKLIKHPCFQLSSPGDMDSIKKLAEAPESIKPIVPGKLGKVEKFNILDEYVEEVSDKFVSVKNLKIVVDYGNGMGSITAKPVFAKLGLKVIPLYEEIDCTFPNHQANPLEEKNLEELRKRVVAEKADLGVAFDGDSDRGLLIDDKGGIIYPDIATAILVPYALKGRAEKRIYYDLRFSRVVLDVIKANHGHAMMMRVGNPFYKAKLSKEGGVMAAELSGHVMFQDHYCIDDGLYTSLKVMKDVVASGKKLSALAEPLKEKYHTSPEINLKVHDAAEALRKVEDAFLDGDHIDLDGVYVSYHDWWFSLRKSNTEPVVRLRLEANTAEKLESMKKKILGILSAV